MEAELYRFPNKMLRAKAISEYMRLYGYDRAVCFSCGHASAALKAEGINTLDVSVTGSLMACKWFTMGEIRNTFPTWFDATSGHLPMECMLLVAKKYKEYLKTIPSVINLPTGSGETLVCLKVAFPDVKITAVYNLDDATRYEEGAPLNKMVELLADSIVGVDLPCEAV